jgi:hypothetical protein
MQTSSRPRRGAVVLGVILLVLTATTTGASAIVAGPGAGNDDFTFVKAVAFDALANDTAQTGVPRITGTTAPSHGTASCGPLGGCLYTANAGYTGDDSFTYTITDDTTLTATGTVTLHVTSSPAGPLAAIEDDLATTAGAARSINVLTNDIGGAGGNVVVPAATTSPSHGTVSCATNGDCQYTPTAGFSGTDGFVYTVKDSTNASKSAAVHVTVAPANASFALVTDGSGTGTGANWKVGATPSNVPDAAAAAVGVPSVAAAPESPQAIVPASVNAAPNWSGSGNASSLTGTATARALAGDSINALFPPPLPPISQGTGGDGHVPILVGSRVFGYYHHTYPTSITCIDRQTGVACPTYPRQLNVGGSYALGPSVVTGTRFWTRLYTATGYAQTAGVGLYCWDASTDSTCGLTIVDRAPTTLQPQISAPRLANGKMWFGGDTGQLYCVDPVNGAPCGSIATGLGAAFVGEWSGQGYDSIAHGNLVFLSRLSDAAMSCIDVVAGAQCAGWTSHPALSDTHNLVTRYNGQGQVIGICEASGSNTLVCAPDNDPTSKTTLTGWLSGDTQYSSTSEAETGTRTLYGSLSYGGLSCYDWTTSAGCTGGQYSGGRLSVDKNGNGLPSAYGAAFDGACVVGLGDPGQVFTVDPAGTSPCTSLATGSSGRVIDLRAQRCDGTVGAATWGRVAILDANLTSGTGDFTSLVVTVKDAASGAVLATKEMVGTNGTLDLSGIDPNLHPSLTVGANAAATSSSTAWNSGNWPKANINWNADARALCFQTQQPPCPQVQQAAALNASLSSGATKRTVVSVPACADGGGGTPTVPKANGYTLVSADGGAFTFGLPFLGTRSIRAKALTAPSGAPLNAAVVGAAATPSQQGYYLAAADGGVFTFGDAVFAGSMGGQRLNKPIVGMAVSPTGGYWLVASDGGVFTFGGAGFFGSTGAMKLNKPIVGMASSASGAGYYLVASDGGIFTFGDAVFSGSTGDLVLNKPIVGMASSPTGGYWLVASDGGVFTFGGVPFLGSLSGTKLNSPATGIASTPSGKGYTITAADGGVFNFGDSPALGSIAGLQLRAPVVAILSI